MCAAYGVTANTYLPSLREVVATSILLVPTSIRSNPGPDVNIFNAQSNATLSSPILTLLLCLMRLNMRSQKVCSFHLLLHFFKNSPPQICVPHVHSQRAESLHQESLERRPSCL